MNNLIMNPDSFKFTDFIDQFDKENSIIILAGKRKVLEADKPKLLELGRLLTENTSKIVFRSGNADGADKLFSEGVININTEKLQAITPYLGHKHLNNNIKNTISLDSIDLKYEDDLIAAAKKNRNAKGLVEEYLKGVVKLLKSKGAYLLRDTLMVTGTNSGILPASFAIFYDDLRNPQKGGTGHTMLMCKERKVPFIDQSIWMKWL